MKRVKYCVVGLLLFCMLVVSAHGDGTSYEMQPIPQDQPASGPDSMPSATESPENTRRLNGMFYNYWTQIGSRLEGEPVCGNRI